MQFSEILSSFLQFAYAPWILGLLALLLYGGLLYLAGGVAFVIHTPWLLALFLLVLAVGVFAFIWWGLPWWRKRRALGQDALSTTEESTANCKTNFLQGLQELEHLEHGQTRPHFLLLGESASGKTAVLQGAKFTCLTPALNAGSTRNCAWWASLQAAVLDTTGRYTIPVDTARDPEGWHLVLRLLLQHRPDVAINGVLVSLAADTLANRSPEQLRGDADKLRQRLQEAVTILGVDFPVYLLITKCDLLEGFHDFFAQFPERVAGEALGYVNPEARPLSTNGTATSRGKATLISLEKGLQIIYDRLHFFRLSLLNSRIPEEASASVFCFPEECKALYRAVSTVAEVLFEDRVGFHPLLFRGVFFVSAQQQDAPVPLLRRSLNLTDELPPFSGRSQPYFLNDLFTTLLPRDAELASTTTQMQTRRSTKGFLRAFTWVFLLFVLLLLILRTYLTDRQIVAAVNQDACSATVTQQGSLQASLQKAEGCRQVVDAVATRNRQRSWWTSIGFRRSFRLERTLRQQYLLNYKASVLEPLDTALDQTIGHTNQPREDPLALVLALARRVRLIQQCLSREQCNAALTDSNMPDYSLLLDPQSSSSAPSPAGKTLQTTYTAYLRWQDHPQVDLQPDLEKSRHLLQRTLSPQIFTPERLLQWLERKGAQQIRYEDYWKLPDLVGKPPPSVNRACSKEVWERDLAPILQSVQGLVQEASSSLSTFQKSYTKHCLDQWQNFLAAFPSGAERWNQADRRRELAVLLLGQDSPYQQVIATITANLQAWLPSKEPSESFPSWTEKLSTLAASPEYKEYQNLLKKLSDQLGAELAPEAALTVAREAFSEAQPTEPPAHPVLAASAIATKLAPQEGSPQAGGQDLVSPLLQEPVRYVWRVTLEQTYKALQGSLRETLTSSPSGALLPAAEKFAAVYGPGGKLSRFTAQAQPFLSKEDGRPKTVLGVSVPFTPELLQLLKDTQQLSPLLDGTGSPQQVAIQASQHAKIGGFTPLVEEQTILSIDCAPQREQITNVPQGAFKASVNVLWSYQNCKEALVIVYLSTRPPGGGETTPSSSAAQKFQLQKQYGGPNGVVQFFCDFLEGSHNFQLSDFAPNPEIRTILQDGATPVTVYYTLTLPPVLKKALLSISTTLPKGLASPTSMERAIALG